MLDVLSSMTIGTQVGSAQFVLLIMIGMTAILSLTLTLYMMSFRNKQLLDLFLMVREVAFVVISIRLFLTHFHGGVGIIYVVSSYMFVTLACALSLIALLREHYLLSETIE